MERKQKQFDKFIQEWKQKCEDTSLELEASQQEARLYSTELFKIKSNYEESIEVAEALRAENKNLANEIRDLIGQLSEGGKNSHELEKTCKRFELERQELVASLEEAERQGGDEARKVAKVQMELAYARQDMARRLQEKDEEFELTKFVFVLVYFENLQFLWFLLFFHT